MGIFLSPDALLRAVHIDGSMHVADFGAGPGYLTLPLAKILSDGGVVYAFDVQKSSLESIRSSAERDGLHNVEVIWTDLERPQATKLKENSLDLVFIVNILFQAEKKDAVMKEAYRILKSGGRAIVSDWDDSYTPVGPRPEERISKTGLTSLMEAIGFRAVKEFDAGSNHYGIVFVKQ